MVREQRLSQSVLWELQRRFFEQQGIDAWRQGIVPSYITSNPFIAQAYARVVFGFLRDCHAMRQGTASSRLASCDPAQPIYIIELGSGSGRFAYLFLKKLRTMLERSALSEISFQYIMTDFNEQLVEYWESHPSLRAWTEAGILDFARFDAEGDQTLTLRRSGTLLTPQIPGNPLIILANYFFDGIPQDAFYIKDGRLFDCLISISLPPGKSELTDLETLREAEVTYQRSPVTGDAYEEAAFNQLLEEYQQRLNQTVLLFPHMALRCLDNLLHLARGRLLLLSADKGYGLEASLSHQGEPAIDLHGSFSMMVNYHAMGQYVLKQGGIFLRPDDPTNHLSICAFILGLSATESMEACHAYREMIEQSNPDDFYTLKKGVEKSYATLTLAELLAYLRLSGWDSNILLGCLSILLEHLKTAPEPLKREIPRMVQQLWDHYYPIGEEKDLAFWLGLVLCAIEQYGEALPYFQRSLQLYGPQLHTIYNMGLCHYHLGEMERATEALRQALLLDPELEMAKKLQLKILAARYHKKL